MIESIKCSIIGKWVTGLKSIFLNLSFLISWSSPCDPEWRSSARWGCSSRGCQCCRSRPPWSCSHWTHNAPDHCGNDASWLHWRDKLASHCWYSSWQTVLHLGQMQGLQYILTQNNSSLLQNFESERLPRPNGGSPDVVHLIKYASLVFGWLRAATPVRIFAKRPLSACFDKLGPKTDRLWLKRPRFQ